MGIESLVLPGFDSSTGLFMVPWWAAAAIAAFLVVVVVLAMLRGGLVVAVGGVVSVACLALVVAIVSVGSTRLAERERVDERRALLTQAQNLVVQAAAPGSVLACLDGAVGDTVEAVCERALFAGPETVAQATAYTTARLALLSDAVDYALRANVSYEGALPGLRATLESDRFGFVAQVLASRYGCSPEHCDAFTLFRDTARITSNLKEHAYDIYVARYAAAWQARPSRSPVASNSGASVVPPGFNVPSAAAIPPVNIMVPEPPVGTVPNSAPAEAAATPPAPPRRPAPSKARPARASTNAPVQIVPPAPTAPPPANTGNPPGTQ
ncbi:MAG: hypothetical protein ACJ8D0_03360 [Xanthobacteraceae bacterium]